MIPSIGGMRILNRKTNSSVLLTDSTNNVYCVDLSCPGYATSNIVASYSGGASILPFSTLNNMAIAQFAETGNCVIINNLGQIVANVVIPNTNKDCIGGWTLQVDGDLSCFHLSGETDSPAETDEFTRVNAIAGTYSMISARHFSRNFQVHFNEANPDIMVAHSHNEICFYKTIDGGTNWSYLGMCSRHSSCIHWIDGLLLESTGNDSYSDTEYSVDGSTIVTLSDSPSYIMGGQPVSKDVIHFFMSKTNNIRCELTSGGITSYVVTGMPTTVTEKIVIPCKNNKNIIVVASIESGLLYFYSTTNRGANWSKSTSAGAASNLSATGGAISNDGRYAIAIDQGQSVNSFILDIRRNSVKSYVSLGATSRVVNM